MHACGGSEPSPVASAQIPSPAAPETEQELSPVASEQELSPAALGTERVCVDRHLGASLSVLGRALRLPCWSRCCLRHRLARSHLVAGFFASGTFFAISFVLY